MFNFIVAYIVTLIITDISRSYSEDFILSILVLVPIILAMVIYTRTKYKKMGSPLINLEKAPTNMPGIRAATIIFILLAIFLVVVSYFGKHRIAIPWLILIVLQLSYGIFMENTLTKGLMRNGIWTGNRLIRWGAIKAFKWMGTKGGFATLKIEYQEYYFFQTAILKVISDQKEEVDGLFKKMVRA
ncbi:hypothetical protein [Desulfosporosinus sp. FKA]|uniref:hypothetical protein n=1 Tax=Desulfosporosinus sp. FKA TaxID=1969834 RepID=UPI000B49B715|nr:hypothetical protein [Desulfosporosinus sp. FKA]